MTGARPPNDCDVLVIGGGGAGLAAAIEARAAGASVLLLEKGAAPGGSTAWSVGSVTASGTPHQQAKGIVDTPEEHWRDMAAFNGDLDPRDNPLLRRILCDAMPDTFRWLLSHGVRFHGPMPEPPHSKPRMHTVLPNSRSFIANLSRAARRAGVEISCGARAVALATEDGRVTGVDAETRQGRQRIHARGGVILATGDFTSDPELKTRFMGPRHARIPGINGAATGDGQKLALPLGARILNGDLALGPELRFVPPRRPNRLAGMPSWPLLADLMTWSMNHLPERFLRPFMMSFITTVLAPSPTLFEQGAILVNADGRRFADEMDEPAFALPDQPRREAFILLDARIAARFSAWPHFISTAPGVAYAYIEDYRRNRPDVFMSAPTLTDLARNLGMSPKALGRTVEEHNAAAHRPPLGDGPYVALGPLRAIFVHAEGGLAVDAEHRVLGASDQPIRGLYAAGSAGQGGLLLKGHGHHLAWAFASGRRAGHRAALAAIAAA